LATLIDTSALYILLDEDGPNHPTALRIFGRLRTRDQRLVLHSYALSESIALLQRRVGLDAVRRLVDGILPVVEIAWVDRELHDRAVGVMLASGRRTVSLVDHVSFILMRDRHIRTAFAFDRDFADQGFEVLGV
jgi:predicted nucleic acid-binding protein